MTRQETKDLLQIIIKESKLINCNLINKQLSHLPASEVNSKLTYKTSLNHLDDLKKIMRLDKLPQLIDLEIFNDYNMEVSGSRIEYVSKGVDYTIFCIEFRILKDDRIEKILDSHYNQINAFKSI